MGRMDGERHELGEGGRIVVDADATHDATIVVADHAIVVDMRLNEGLAAWECEAFVDELIVELSE